MTLEEIATIAIITNTGIQAIWFYITVIQEHRWKKKNRKLMKERYDD